MNVNTIAKSIGAVLEDNIDFNAIFKPRNRPEWLIAIDREAHESVCTKSIMERERSLLTAHIRIVLAGKSAGLAQFMANREAARG